VKNLQISVGAIHAGNVDGTAFKDFILNRNNVNISTEADIKSVGITAGEKF
jgi:hypothetical protein